MMKVSVQVQPTDRSVFQAETQGAISDTWHPKYQPGSAVWVNFSPNDLTQVALDHT